LFCLKLNPVCEIGYAIYAKWELQDYKVHVRLFTQIEDLARTTDSWCENNCKALRTVGKQQLEPILDAVANSIAIFVLKNQRHAITNLR